MTWRDVERDTPGWLHPEEGPALNEWAGRSPGVLVEIGSFAGKSTLWIAEAAAYPVVSIDPHRGNEEMRKGRECFIPEAWDERRCLVDSTPLLRSTLERSGFADKVTVIVAESSQVARWWSTPVGFLFIDGDHGEQVTEDYRLWSPFLMGDGILAFHDTAVPAVGVAVGEAERDGWKERQVVNDCLRVFTR